MFSPSFDYSFSKRGKGIYGVFKLIHTQQTATTKMNIMNILGQNHTTTTRSTLDYSIVACFTLILLLFILLLDAYEYVAVPGASHARNQLHQGLEDITGMKMMTKQELAQLKLDVEQAKSVVHDKKEEVEEIVEKVELMEHELKPDTVPVTEEEQEEEKEKEQEIVQKTVEKELGIDKWCGSCKWKDTGFSCDRRVSWLMERYHIEELEAKEASLNQGCHTRRNLRRRHD